MASINQQDDTRVTYSFDITRSGTLLGVTLPAFYMTFFDLERGAMIERLDLKDYTSYKLRSNTYLQVTQPGAWTQFKPDYTITQIDNPVRDQALTGKQERAAVTVLYTNRSSFSIRFHVSDLSSGTGGRNIMFDGISSLLDRCSFPPSPPAPSPPPSPPPPSPPPSPPPPSPPPPSSPHPSPPP
eukprot:3108540-Prymnesium_polylepis.1